MEKDRSEVAKLISEYGVSVDCAKLYICLLSGGPQGIMSLTKESNLGRNIVYRLIDELQQNGLVSVIERSHGKIYNAQPVEIFDSIVADTKTKASQLEKGLANLQSQLLSFVGSSGVGSDILHYEGERGLRYVNWNLTNADKEYRVYEQSHLHEYLDAEMEESFTRTIISKKITSYDLTNKKRVKNSYSAFDKEYWDTKVNYRYISPDQLKISYEIYIYNDIVALLDYSSSVPHCVEIRNENLARMQKQIYDAIWSTARDFEKNTTTGDLYVA